MKIQIIGYSGSGKSTLARKLGELLDIHVLHLDAIKFYGNWDERTQEEQERIVSMFLEENDSWVIDGNYSSICNYRFYETDITIFLNYNRFYCYKMCKKRYKMYKGVSRPDCKCTEKFDKQFKKWILVDGRTKKRRKKHLENLNKTNGTKLIFKNRKQLNKWFINFEKNYKR